MGRKSGTRVFVPCKFCKGAKRSSVEDPETGKVYFEKCQFCNGRGGRYLAVSQ